MKNKGIILLTIALLQFSVQFAHANWLLTFSDEFNGTNLNTSKWLTTYPGGGLAAGGNGEQEYYTDQAFSFPAPGANGYLQINTSKLTQPYFQCLNGTCQYTSGLINTQSRFAQTYGYFEMRAKLSSGKGLWPAFWLMPGDLTSYSWTSGYEIDIMEMGGGAPSVDYMTLHAPSGVYGSSTSAGGDLSAGFHTFAVDWEPGVLTWYLDGVQRNQITGSNVPSISMYLIANLAIGGSWSAVGYPDSATITKIANDTVPIQIDYIRVYQKAASGGYSAIPGPSTVPLLNGHAVNLPQTGQAFCVQPGTQTLVPCSGTGQDGETQQGIAWPAQRFSPNADTTLTDNLTGLIWGPNAGAPALASCSGGAQDWQGALDYVTCLNGNNYLGHGDWRLPNINELATLVNMGGAPDFSWLTAQGFSGIQPGGSYTSSTSGADLPAKAYAFTYGSSYGLQLLDKSGNLFFAWPLRGGQNGTIDQAFPANVPRTGQNTCYDASGTITPCAGSGQDGEGQNGAAWPSPRFNKNADTTLTDALTGLTWAPNAGAPTFATCSGGAHAWQDALSYLSCLNNNNYLGHNDWRLPNSVELPSLVNFGKSSADNWYASQGFAGVAPQMPYWTSDTVAGNPYVGNLLSDGFSLMATSFASNTANILPVRGGSGLHGPPAAAINPTSFFWAGTSTVDPTFLVVNSGQNLLNIATVTISGTNPADFAVYDDICSGTTLLPGASCTVNATFDPQSAGDKAATLTVSSNGAPVSAPLTASSATEFPLTVTLTGTGSGSVAGSSTGTPATFSFTASSSIPLSSGAVATLTPTAGTNANFASWTGCDQVNGSKCTVTMNTAKSLTAQFNIKTFTVTFSAGAGGSLTGTTSQTVSYGGSATPVTANAATGYHFVNWTDANNRVVGSTTTLTVSSVTASGTFSANFASNVANLPDLTIAKSHSGNFVQGQIGATYTITARNSGTGPTSGTVTVIDTLPSGLTATALGGSGWSCTLSRLTCTRSDALAAGSSYPPLTLTVNVAGNAPLSLTNSASVAGGGETNSSNNTAADLTSVAAATGPSFIQVTSNDPQGTVSSVAATYPGAQSAGNLNYVAIGWADATSSVKSVTDNKGNVYTLALGPTRGVSGSNAISQSIYYAIAKGGSGTTVTVTFNTAVPWPDLRIAEYAGVSTLDKAVGAAGTATTCNSGSVTTTAARELLVGANYVAQMTTASGTGFTQRVMTQDQQIVEDRVVSAVGSYNATATVNSGNWVMQLATFK